MTRTVARGRWEAQEIAEVAPAKSSARNWMITIGLFAAAGLGAYVLWPAPEPKPAPPPEVPAP